MVFIFRLEREKQELRDYMEKDKKAMREKLSKEVLTKALRKVANSMFRSFGKVKILKILKLTKILSHNQIFIFAK